MNKLIKFLKFLKSNFWSSGVHLVLITVLCTFISFLSLMVRSSDSGIITNESIRSSILYALNSKQWQFALVANIGVGIPVTIDFIVELVHSITTKSNKDGRASVPRLFLIFSLVGPNLLLLLVGIPLQYAELVICFFATRLILLLYGVLGHLWIIGGDLFRSNWFLMGHIGLCVGTVFVTYDTMVSNEVTSLFWLGISFDSVAAIIISVYCLKFLMMIRKVGINNLDTSQLSCLLYIILLSSLGGYCYVSGIIYRGEYNVEFFVQYTYIEAVFTLFLTASQSILIRYDEISTKDVSNSYRYDK